MSSAKAGGKPMLMPMPVEKHRVELGQLDASNQGDKRAVDSKASQSDALQSADASDRIENHVQT